MAFAQGLAELGWTVAVTFGSNTAGARAIPTAFVDTLRNWSRSRRTLSWLQPGDRGAVSSASRTLPIVYVTRRSGRRWLGREPGAAGRERHRLCPIRIQYQRERLELLKEIAPGVKRVAVIRDPAVAGRVRWVGRDPGRGAFVRGGVKSGRGARPGEIERASRHLRGGRTAV